MKKIKTAIVGATGFTGSELARILINHPVFEPAFITSESHSGKKFSDVHPQFFGLLDLHLVEAAELKNSGAELLFLALPHGISMDYVKSLSNTSAKIVDLSGDYRLSSPEVYNHWYTRKHIHPEGFKEAAYGLPELFSEQIKESKLVANPGCYPTSAILGLYPLVREGLVDLSNIIVDAKSGTTGAGVKSNPGTHYCQVNENFNAYGIAGHRHTIEIEEKLSMYAGQTIKLQFTPHLLPVDRGILSTIYAPIKDGVQSTARQVKEVFRAHYKSCPFIRMRETAPGIKEVRGTNFCDIFPTYDPRTGNFIVISAIDNLMKGAAGQAVHNANLMYGLKETTGLINVALKP
ncbi:MAG: N-acetyl-gamma-glutamyl-phosphate reductase [Saprospirales bacterium]|nr:MAG: N-acetyl-gamma-glutamyl-phosphate reductase [Saprospirales bacterium]